MRKKLLLAVALPLALASCGGSGDKSTNDYGVVNVSASNVNSVEASSTNKTVSIDLTIRALKNMSYAPMSVGVFILTPSGGSEIMATSVTGAYPCGKDQINIGLSEGQEVTCNLKFDVPKSYNSGKLMYFFGSSRTSPVINVSF